MDRLQTLSRRLAELQPTAAQHELEIRGVLSELRTQRMSVALLQQTKVGHTVNRIRRATGISEECKEQANALVNEWKEMVRLAATTTASAAAAPSASGAAPSPAAAGSSSASSLPTAAPAASGDGKRKLDAAETQRDEAAKKLKANAAASPSSPPRAHPASSPSPSPPPASSPTAASSPSRAAPSASPSASSPSFSSPARAPSAPVALPPPPLYNPNLALYRAAAAASYRSASATMDSTSRKSTHSGSSFDAFLGGGGSRGGGGAAAAPVQLCSLETMCIDAISHHLDKFTHLDAMPLPIMIRILAKATPEQLTRFEQYNPRLLGETESLWQGHCRKSFPAFRESDKAPERTWKSVFSEQAQKKADKMADVSARLKRMQQKEQAVKQSNAVRAIGLQQAVRLENKGKRTGPAASAPSGPQPVSRLSQLKQQSRAIANMKFGHSR